MGMFGSVCTHFSTHNSLWSSCWALSHLVAPYLILARAGTGYLRIVDRDYVELSNLQRQWLFDESDASVKRLIRMLIQSAHKAGRKVGICGEAPSNDIEFAAFLVDAGIDSISLQPDSVLQVIKRVAEMEQN